MAPSSSVAASTAPASRSSGEAIPTHAATSGLARHSVTTAAATAGSGGFETSRIGVECPHGRHGHPAADAGGQVTPADADHVRDADVPAVQQGHHLLRPGAR